MKIGFINEKAPRLVSTPVLVFPSFCLLGRVELKGSKVHTLILAIMAVIKNKHCSFFKLVSFFSAKQKSTTSLRYRCAFYVVLRLEVLPLEQGITVGGMSDPSNDQHFSQ